MHLKLHLFLHFFYTQLYFRDIASNSVIAATDKMTSLPHGAGPYQVHKGTSSKWETQASLSNLSYNDKVASKEKLCQLLKIIANMCHKSLQKKKKDFPKKKPFFPTSKTIPVFTSLPQCGL